MTDTGWSLLTVAHLGDGECEEVWATIDSDGTRRTAYCRRWHPPGRIPEPQHGMVNILHRDEDLSDYESHYDGPTDDILPLPRMAGDAES